MVKVSHVFIGAAALSLLLTTAPSNVTAHQDTHIAANQYSPIKEALKSIQTQSAKAGQWQTKALNKFYRNRNYEPFWLEGNQFKRSVNTWVGVIKAADLEGLNTSDYQFSTLVKAPLPTTETALAQRDIQLTNSVLHYIRDLSIGRSQPAEIFPTLFLHPQNRDFSSMLEQVAANEHNLQQGFQKLAPQHEDYQRLRKALAHYRNLAKNMENWQPIATEGLIRPGGKDQRMPEIRQRMQILGRLEGQQNIFKNLQQKAVTEIKEELSEEISAVKNAETPQELAEAKDNLPNNPTWIYDAVTEKAIRRFQEISGATVDGVIGPKTIAELNTPISNRIDQIIVSMERWRWLPTTLGSKYVLANIAGFYTEGVQNNNVIVRSPIIVGQVAHQTPAFSSHITNVKFYPDWSVPASIAQRYLLGKIQKSPGVINALGYELYRGSNRVNWNSVNIQSLRKSDFPPYRFRQQPGPKNALGMVRFSIDNNQAIYMHDTSNPELFAEQSRAFSSGCIRVQKREDMAAFLLDGNSKLSGSEARQKFAVTGTNLKPEYHVLKQKVPVHLVYMTAWVDPAGDIKFGQDIYNRDKKLIRALKRQEGAL